MTVRFYVFGAGHVARELVPLLSHLGFKCIVLDDRAEFADAAAFPQAEHVQQVDFTKLQEVCSLTAKDYAVVMTRGHVHDANVERYLLTTPVGYIGIMGSKNKQPWPEPLCWRTVTASSSSRVLLRPSAST